MRKRIVACAAVIEEILPLLPPDIRAETLDFGLHRNPEELRSRLQQKIDSAAGDTDAIILGYGLCSMAVIGLTSASCALVVPRVDDCIALFLGSAAAYRKQAQQEPGTYYLTKGWIEAADTPFREHDRTVERYGRQMADRVMSVMLRNYKRLAFIDTGRHQQWKYRELARRTADRFGLRYEKISGSTVLLRRMLFGPWGDDFIVTPPGEAIRYIDFKDSPDPPGRSPVAQADRSGRTMSADSR